MLLEYKTMDVGRLLPWHIAHFVITYTALSYILHKDINDRNTFSNDILEMTSTFIWEEF